MRLRTFQFQKQLLGVIPEPSLGGCELRPPPGPYLQTAAVQLGASRGGQNTQSEVIKILKAKHLKVR